MVYHTIREVVYVDDWTWAAVVHGGRRTQVARGEAGRGNIQFLLYFLW